MTHAVFTGCTFETTEGARHGIHIPCTFGGFCEEVTRIGWKRTGSREHLVTIERDFVPVHLPPFEPRQ